MYIKVTPVSRTYCTMSLVTKEIFEKDLSLLLEEQCPLINFKFVKFNYLNLFKYVLEGIV